MTMRSRLAIAIFFVGLAATAALIFVAAGAMFRRGLDYEAVFWLVGWAAIFGVLIGAAEMARRERRPAAVEAYGAEEFCAPEGGLSRREVS